MVFCGEGIGDGEGVGERKGRGRGCERTGHRVGVGRGWCEERETGSRYKGEGRRWEAFSCSKGVRWGG